MAKMILTLFLFLMVTSSVLAADFYKDYLDLAQHEREGVAYHVDILNRHANVAIIAIHGGKIEPGSDQFAREVAGTDLNFYAFIAILPKNNRRLHVTSTHFDDPRALDLVKVSTFVISMHGFKETAQDRICVGGGNAERRDRIAADLKKSDLNITIESPCEEFGGSDAANIVNRGKNPGVQLEMSTHLRDRLVEDSSLMKRLAAIIRVEALR